MRLPFQVYADLDGNLSVMDGVVIEVRTGQVFSTAAGDEFAHDGPDRDYRELSRVGGGSSAVFAGGSARNLVCSGPVASGFFRPEIAGQFRNGAFVLTVTGPSAATISDGVDVVATLTTGGAAPAGVYDSTTYGADTYASGTPFALTVDAEDGGPGAIPDASVTISSGTARDGLFTAVDPSNYVSAADPLWTIELDPAGEGRLFYDSALVAVRAEGSAFDPSGRYDSTAAGLIFNAAAAPEEIADDDELPEINPFGILTITYSWDAAPDLDTGTTFLDVTVGYAHPGESDYMTFSGDDTSPSGSETVTIDLAAAWDAGEIEGFADVLCMADWYPPRGGFGPAQLEISYSLGGELFSGTIYPGPLSPSTTPVKGIRIFADASMVAFEEPWSATVRRVPQPTRAGVVFLKLTETAGLLSAVDGPFFATSLPACTPTEFYFPIALSDGAGGIEQYHTGALAWRGNGWQIITPANELEITQDGTTYYLPLSIRP